MAWKEMTWDYVAGFFDGEGCINCRAGTQGNQGQYVYRRWRCIFYQNDSAVLNEISEFLSNEGIPSIVRDHQFNGKEMSKTLDIGGAIYTYKFLLKVEPYLRVKHDQAFDVINELEELMMQAEKDELGSPRANATYRNLRAVN